MFCWQLRDLGTVPGYESSVAPMEVAQRYAESIVTKMAGDSPCPPVFR